jgi:hypothetical protein
LFEPVKVFRAKISPPISGVNLFKPNLGDGGRQSCDGAILAAICEKEDNLGDCVIKARSFTL